MRIATVGDNCMDVYQASGKAYPGGNPVNVAVYLKRLGADSTYIGWVGTDQYGDRMIQALQEKGVDTTHLSQKEGNTAVTHVELVGGDRQFGHYDEGIMSDFSLTEEELNFIAAYQLVHAGIWGHAEQYYPSFKDRGLVTSFDFSDKLNHPLVKTLPQFVDYSFFSYNQDDAFIRQFLMNMKSLGTKIAVATLAENGSLAYDGQQYYKCGVRDIDVVDTMGAGDSFISGFIFGMLNDLPIDKSLELGTVTAAKTISYFGAW